jgi:hypothetical protein
MAKLNLISLANFTADRDEPVEGARDLMAEALVESGKEVLARKGAGKQEGAKKVAPALLSPVRLPTVEEFDFGAFVRPELDAALEASKGLMAQARKEREEKLVKKGAARLAAIEAEKAANAAKREMGFAAQRAVAANAWEAAAKKAAEVLAQAESLRGNALTLATQVANVKGRVEALKQKARSKGLTSAEAHQGAALMGEMAKCTAEAQAAKAVFDGALASALAAQEAAMMLFSFDARKGVDTFVDQLLEAQQLNEAEKLLDLAVHFGQSAEFAGMSNLLSAVRACRNSGKEWVRKDLKGQVVEAAPAPAPVVVIPAGAKPSLTATEIAANEEAAKKAAEEKKAAELPKLQAAVEAAKEVVSKTAVQVESCRKQLDALGGPAKIVGSGKNARREVLGGARAKAQATWKAAQERAEKAVAELRRAEAHLAR